MKSGRLIVLSSLVALVGCSSQNPAPNNPTPQAPQASSAAAPANTSIVQHDGCTIDFAKVCQTYIDQPQFTYNGDEYDWTRFQQSFSRHPDVEVWARYDNGDVVADIECHIDTQNRKVDWARLLANPPLTDKSWAYAKSKRWCQEDSPDYAGWTAYWNSGTTHQ
jgi:hypothetical protein